MFLMCQIFTTVVFHDRWHLIHVQKVQEQAKTQTLWHSVCRVCDDRLGPANYDEAEPVVEVQLDPVQCVLLDQVVDQLLKLRGHSN